MGNWEAAGKSGLIRFVSNDITKKTNGRKKSSTVVFIHTDASEHLYLRFSEELSAAGIAHLPLKLQSPTNLPDIETTVFEFLKGIPPEDMITLNFTGGTKPIVSAIVAAAELVAVDGRDITLEYIVPDRGKKGKPIDNTEKIMAFENHTSSDRINEYMIRKFSELYYFSAAKKRAEKLLTNMNKGSIIDTLDLFYEWDNFNHGSAIKNGDGALLSKENWSYLQNLAKLKKGKDYPGQLRMLLPDLINNSSRRIKQGRYNAAVATTYRAMEMIAQLLLSNYGIYDEHNGLRLADVTEDTQKVVDEFKLENRLELPLRLGYRRKLYLLQELGNRLSEEMLNDLELESSMSLRNDSIFAHGTGSISGERAKEFLDICESYATKAIRRKEFLKLKTGASFDLYPLFNKLQ